MSRIGTENILFVASAVFNLPSRVLIVVDRGSNVENFVPKKLPYANAIRAENGQLAPVPEVNDSCEDIATNEIYKYGGIRSARAIVEVVYCVSVLKVRRWNGTVGRHDESRYYVPRETEKRNNRRLVAVRRWRYFIIRDVCFFVCWFLSLIVSISSQGLTLLLPYIISTRRSWSSCKLRVFALAGNDDTVEFEQRKYAPVFFNEFM